MWYTQVTEVNHAENAFYTLGGAGWLTLDEAVADFGRVREVAGQASVEREYSLDLVDEEGDLIDEKLISERSARELLGEDIDSLRLAVKEAIRDSLASIGVTK